MASDYQAIREENKIEYGNVGRWGKSLLADRYDTRTHFIYELLQNAEDALGRHLEWDGSRAVTFDLTEQMLRISHFGKPFTEADVRGVCGIDESTKELTEIGRFGIGFKSVCALTDRPEIHSGDEAFAIENYAFPTQVQPIVRKPDETVFLLPFTNQDRDMQNNTANALRHLGSSALLFLRQIEEIKWSVSNEQGGTFLRETLAIEDWVREVTVIGEGPEENVDERWLVFSRPLFADDSESAGYAEIAFLLDSATDGIKVQPVHVSPLVVYFPTAVETRLGFIVQGPYRTTPSRDNVPSTVDWNRYVVNETAVLIVDALRWFREKRILDTTILECLPLDQSQFGTLSRFAPLYIAVRDALKTEALLPTQNGDYSSGKSVLLARSQELRTIFDSGQISTLFGRRDATWLSNTITQDRTPKLRRYLLDELDVPEVTPESVVSKLTKSFLEAQSDEWILRLYEFLYGQNSLRWRLQSVPIVRLEDGTHVCPKLQDELQAFLPSDVETDFPLVRAHVIKSDSALEFLKRLGLREADPVDDVIYNILPKYDDDFLPISDENYANDIQRILTAYKTDSRIQRTKLIERLRATQFVKSVNAKNGAPQWCTPDILYLATTRLTQLFEQVDDIHFVDTSWDCLRGEAIRDLLEVCGASRTFRVTEYVHTLTKSETYAYYNLRVQAGYAETSRRSDKITNYNIEGLSQLLERLSTLSAGERALRARLLWEELIYLEERRGEGNFIATYSWTHYGDRKVTFDATFVKTLNESAWIPDENGELQRPELVLFETLGWTPNAFLESKIRFKPPIISQLAREAGIDAGALNLLKEYGITEADLIEKFGLHQADSAPVDDTLAEQSETVDKRSEQEDLETTTLQSDAGTSNTPYKNGSSGSDGYGTVTHSGGQSATYSSSSNANPTQRESHTSANSRSNSPSERNFNSYIAAHNEIKNSDPDGLEHEIRLQLETRAIEAILHMEPALQRTATNQPGYDLFETDSDGHAIRWVEVKAMKGSLHDRPATITHTQFEFAQGKGDAYWLYVVEYAGHENPRIVRIPNPAGRASTFTFDAGWESVAEVYDAEDEIGF